MSPALPVVSERAGDRRTGFLIESVTPLPELRSTAIRCRHEKSGARLLHLAADDVENLFAIAFRTPPPDDTGLPHILEHTVLCGSQRFPVKDPFVELLKTSLATFLNAMTYPDKTVYPVASMNAKDFYNLAGVYCDAVFRPLLTEAHFRQEGHHLAFAAKGDSTTELVIQGIVYNEMRGAYSDLDGTIDRELCKSICPDNAYGRDSGGDPEAIPGLTYEQLRTFHARYYHPSNALLFTYGNLPLAGHLAFLDSEYLGGIRSITIDTAIAAQPRWATPRRRTVPYPVGPDETLARKTAEVLTFLTNDLTDAVRSLSMSLLDYVLLGNAASPLRKALIDAKLGEELSDSGYAAHQRDTFFTVGLKGTEADRAEAIEALVLSTCRRLADEGLGRDRIETAFHRLEIHSREIGSSYPLRLMDRVYNSWLYDADPLWLLRLEEHLAELRRRYETVPGFFETQLREMLVENPHYTALTFVPDPQYIARKEAAFTRRMAERGAALTPSELATIREEQESLEVLQDTPNSPEALATLPRLSLADISPEPHELPTVSRVIGGRPFLYTDLFASGLSYLRLSIDLAGVPDELIDWLPLYTEVLRKMGAGREDYVALAEREAAVSGGVSAVAGVSGHVLDPQRVLPFLTLGLKALNHKLPEALRLLQDRLLLCDLTDLARLEDVVKQMRIHLRSRLVPSGNHYATTYAERGLSRTGEIAERIGGVTQIRLFDRLATRFAEEQDGIVERLAAIRAFLQNRSRIVASFVGAEPAAAVAENWLGSLLGQLHDAPTITEPATWPPRLADRIGIATPADVAFVATAALAPGLENPHAPALLLLATQLSYGYLWNEVRVKGGAYGARASYSPIDGVFAYSSYRDPHVRETLTAFSGAARYINMEMPLDRAAVEQAVIGTIKTLDQPLRPEQAVSAALSRYLQGTTPAVRRRFRERLLGLDGAAIRHATEEILVPAFHTAPVCVISSQERLITANRELASGALTIETL